MAANIITLGREGVISDPAKIIDWLMCCFFFSKHSQTTLMFGKVTSLTKILQMHTDDPSGLRETLQRRLTAFLERAFTRVQVDVSTATLEEEGKGGISVSLDIIVSNEGDINRGTISVGYSLTYQSTVLREILEKHSGRNLLELNTWR